MAGLVVLVLLQVEPFESHPQWNFARSSTPSPQRGAHLSQHISPPSTKPIAHRRTQAFSRCSHEPSKFECLSAVVGGQETGAPLPASHVVLHTVRSHPQPHGFHKLHALLRSNDVRLLVLLSPLVRRLANRLVADVSQLAWRVFPPFV